MTDPVGSHVGSIRITGRLGHGGMSEVFLGVDETLEREVALKRVRRDGLGGEARARAVREARILSRLDDPRICRIYDYVEGRSHDWLILERVEGRTLDGLDTAQLPLRERLGIARQIAEVLTLTHAKGIVHRDLKPENVMLTGDGVVKVLDFGIARSDGGPEVGPSGEKTPGSDADLGLETVHGVVLGTVRYMSPEQARGERVGTAADIFALALLVRELISGEPPYPPAERGYGIVGRLTRGEVPDPSAGGKIEPSLAAWIGESLHQDPRKRPGAGRWVRRLSWEMGRARRRRRRLVIGAALATVVAAAAAYTWSLRGTMVDAVSARQEAEASRHEAEHMSDFLVGLFTVADDEAPETVTARQILNRGAERLETEFGSEPATYANMAFTLGNVFQNLGEYDRAEDLLQSSLELREGLEPEPARAIGDSLDALASNERFKGNYAEAARLFERSLELRRSALGPVHEDVASSLNGLAIVERRQGLFEAAERHYMEAVSIRREVFGPKDLTVAKTLNNLALLYYYQGRMDAAESTYREVLDIKEEILPPDHLSLARSLNNLGNLLADDRRYEEAERIYRRSHDIWTRAAGPDHPEAASSLNNLALVFQETGRCDEAEQSLLRVLEIRAANLGTAHADYALALSNLGMVYASCRRFDEAEARLLQAQDVFIAALGETHADVGLNSDRLAIVAFGLGQTSVACTWSRKALAINAESLGAEHRDTLDSRFLVSVCGLLSGRLDEGRRLLDEVLTAYEAAKHYDQMQMRASEMRRLVDSDMPASRWPEAVSRLLAPG